MNSTFKGVPQATEGGLRSETGAEREAGDLVMFTLTPAPWGRGDLSWTCDSSNAEIAWESFVRKRLKFKWKLKNFRPALLQPVKGLWQVEDKQLTIFHKL